jgi:hypothetical protein
MKIFRIVVAVFWSGTLLWLTAMLMGCVCDCILVDVGAGVDRPDRLTGAG